MDKRKKTGYLMTICGAVCWAFSGACGQYLFEHRGMDADWLVTVRLTVAGLLLVLYSLARRGGGALAVAALGAEGESTLSGLHHVDRGYEQLEQVLQGLGAKVHRVEALPEEAHCAQ